MNFQQTRYNNVRINRGSGKLYDVFLDKSSSVFDNGSITLETSDVRG